MEMNEERAREILKPEWIEDNDMWSFWDGCVTYTPRFYRFDFRPEPYRKAIQIMDEELGALNWWMRNKKGE